MKQYTLKNLLPSADKPSFKVNYEEELNPSQLEVAMAIDGPLLVIAGAGSGKTRTLVYRVARLIESGISPRQILVLTFTRKASQEMLKRAGLLLNGSCGPVSGGTFHSTANAILRKYGKPIGLEPSFTILDRSDSEDIIKLLRSNQGFGDKEKQFPRKGTLADLMGQSANRMVSIEETVLEDYPHFSHCLEDLVRFERLYTHYKRTRMLLDYDDLLLMLLQLLESQPEIRQRLSQEYRYILVDEYQDTNKIQAKIIRQLCDSHENIMVVGDDAQSIYSFRGADFRNIIDFPKQFPNTQIFRLEENYRSIQPVLDLTNEIINQATEKFSKNLYTKNEGNKLPVLLSAEDENYQSRFICQKILETREEGVPLSEIAVLFRSSFHSFDLEIELSRHGILYEKRGGFKFIETAHVKDVISHLRIVANPLDAVSWNRLLLLIEGIGPKKSQEIIETLNEKEGSLKTLKAFANRSRKEIQKGLLHLAALIESLTQEATNPSLMIEAAGEYYRPILQRKHDDYPKRLKDLEHLGIIAERYHGLEEFLTDMALEPPTQSVSGVSGNDQDDEKLVLSTIHSAKGLEWHTVFIIWLLDGRFPSVYSFSSEEGLEEERRLLYVAATRAKKGLFMSYPINIYDRVSGNVLSKPTRFLDGIPTKLYESWSLTEGSSDSPSRPWYP